MNREQTRNYLLSLGIKGLNPERLDSEHWDLSNLNFNDVTLARCRLRNSDCSGSTFVRTVLWGADCAWVNFQNAVLWYTDCRKTNFYVADCRNANFGAVTIDDETNFDYANTDGTTFYDMRFLHCRTAASVSVARARIYNPSVISVSAKLNYYKFTRVVERLASKLKFFYKKSFGLIHRDFK